MSSTDVRVGLTAVALLALTAAAVSRKSPPPQIEGPSAWSVQLHLHGSFSEGPGSIDSHSYEGRDVGVDALWWSDHDYRITSFHMLNRFSFDAAELALSDGEDWEPLGAWEHKRKKTLSPAGPLGEQARWEIVDDGDRRALLFEDAEPGAEPTRSGVMLDADGSSLMRSLAAEVELELWVRAVEYGPTARGVVEIVMSEHAPREDCDEVPHRVRYLLGPQAGEPVRAGELLEIPLEVPADTWTRLVLPVTRDVVAGFPFLVGEDNALRQVAFGVETSAGAEARFLFDELEIRHGRAPAEMIPAQAELLERVGAHYPELKQLQGLELSLATPHLNAYYPSGTGPEGAAPDYEALTGVIEGAEPARPADLGPILNPLLTSEVHALGGLVSYNHMYGAAWGIERGKSRRREVLADLVACGAYGADLLEVGYRARGGHDLSEHLWVWDRLALAGLPLVGTGVSDSHGGPDGRWRTDRNNFVSWVYAPSTERDELLEGLRRGRVFFGDLTLFDGQLDLTSERGFAMGQVVLTDRERAVVEFRVEGARERDHLWPVLSGKESARLPLEPAAQPVRLEVPLAADGPSVVRCELRAGDGSVRALSNAIVYVRAVPPAGQIAPRLALDVGGLIARRLDGFELVSARALTADGVPLVELVGSAEGARLELDLTRFGPLARVELEGLEGTWQRDGHRLELRDLRGSGRLQVIGAR